MLEWALRYIKLGWPVIPLRGKLPLTRNGSKDASLNESQVRAWWKEWPNANIGLATGHAFFVIDIDADRGGEDTWDMWRSQYSGAPETIEQVTGGGGKHVLYLLPEFTVLNSKDKIGPGIDVRGSGGYVVAAPSVHPETQRQYAWDGLQEIEQQKIAAAPAWLLRIMQDAERRAPAVKTPEKIAEGGRNDALFRAAARLRRFGWNADEIFASLSQVNKNRCHPPLPESEVRTIANSAARYAPDARADVFAKASQAPPNDEEVALGPADVEAAVDDCIRRNDLLGAVKLADHVAKLLPASQLLITTKLRLHFKGEFPAQAFERTVKAIAHPARPASPPPPAGDGTGENVTGPDLLPFPHTDSGNGERIAKLYGHDLRFCTEMQKWLVWDGRRWAVDDSGMATQRAKVMARMLHAQGVGQANVEKWARSSESQAGIMAGLKRAASEKGVPISVGELDQHPYLLNCENGVVDLRSGDLLPHDRGYLITKLCHITYDANAKCARFLRFLHWAMGDNPENEMTVSTVRLIAFLQRSFGYSLTSDVSEKCAFVFWGPKGNNGKTTLLTVIRTILSEYSAQISIDTLMTSRTQDAAVRADLADLRGARFVTTSEVEKEHRLSEGKLKYITAGMGRIKACRKYENPMEFEATHKLFMDANHRPAVRGTDDAIWRRLKPVPFEISISPTDPEYDNKLLEKLIAESPGILAWMVRGCKQWIADGLGDPPEISQANLEWREHDDPLKEFLEDCCEVGEEMWARSSDLTHSYAWWAKQTRERFPLGREAFGERIASKGFEPSRSRRDGQGKQMRTIEGLQVKPDVLQQMKASGFTRDLALAD